VFLVFVALAYAAPKPTWPSQYQTSMERIVTHRGELWNGKWYFDATLKSDRFDLKMHHTQHGDLSVLDINLYGQEKRYFVETRNHDKPHCSSSALHGSLPVPDFTNYVYVGQKTHHGIKCDVWQYSTNASIHTYYANAATHLPVAFERSQSAGEHEVTTFHDWKNGAQSPDVFNISYVDPGVCNNAELPFVHPVFGPPAEPLLSCDQLKALTHKYFPAKYDTDMICISWYESSWNPHAYNGICCYGLWQINRNHLGEPGCPKTIDGLYDADANAQCARHVLDTQGLNAWTTWTSGDCRDWSKCKA
jgi:hypothetical protein